MISDALKRKLINAGNECIRIATKGEGKVAEGIYHTSSNKYKQAARYRDEVLLEVQLKTPEIRAQTSTAFIRGKGK